MRLVFCGGGSTGDIGAQVPGGLSFSEPVPGECQESWVKAGRNAAWQNGDI